jgi:NifU-like protein involved in Fe-S cluster formation
VIDDPRYGPEVQARVRSLAGAGRLPDGAGIVRAAAGDEEQGARVELDFDVAAGRIREVRYRAFGCPHFVAAASWLTDRLRGAGREDLEAWDWREAADALAVPPAKFGRLLTLQDAVREAARNWPGAAGSTV